MFEKIKTYQPKLHDVMRALQDVRVLGLIVFTVVALLITWSGVKVIDTNYRLQKEIAQVEQENAVRELENQNLRLQNAYYETDTYLELEARRNFGKAAPGEAVLVVPKDVALAHTIPVEEPAAEAAPQKDTQSNVSAWIDFLLHREGSSPAAN